MDTTDQSFDAMPTPQAYPMELVRLEKVAWQMAGRA
jgi:hypothetical protein